MTCKIRSGWNEEMRDPVTIALRCQDAGARVLALHPRTRTQMYTGHAHWDEIAAVVQALDIPVLGNGDIKTADDAVRMHRETGCAGVMIARGSFGQPWIFDQTRDLLDWATHAADAGGGRARSPSPSSTRAWRRRTSPTDAARRSSSASTSAGTCKGCPGSAELRKKLHAVDVPRRDRGHLRRISAHAGPVRAAPNRPPTRHGWRR